MKFTLWTCTDKEKHLSLHHNYNRHVNMKKSIKSINCIVLLTILLNVWACDQNEMASDSKNVTKHSLYIPETRKSLGFIKKNNGIKSTSFLLKNKDEDTIFIKKVAVSCGCLKASVSNDTILPKKTEKLIVQLNPRKQQGYFNKAIFITTSDEYLQIVRIKGTIK